MVQKEQTDEEVETVEASVCILAGDFNREEKERVKNDFSPRKVRGASSVQRGIELAAKLQVPVVINSATPFSMLLSLIERAELLHDHEIEVYLFLSDGYWPFSAKAVEAMAVKKHTAED